MRHRLKLSVGLALGGGAARGMAHIGVLRVLARAKIPVDMIVGTSMGAIIGGAYAATDDIDYVEGKSREVLGSESFQKNRLSFLRETKKERGGLFFSVSNLVRRGIFFGVSNLRPSFISAEEFAHSLEAIVPEMRIEDMKLPFGAVALDLESAEEVLIRGGNLRRAASASSAIPGILPPVRHDGRVLIDGGWVNKIPVMPTFGMGADVVIAVDITADVVEVRDFSRGVDIMMRANSIKDEKMVSYQRRMADVVIQPEVRRVHWADFGAFERCIEAGEQAAEAAIPAIRDVLRHERLFSIVRPGGGKRLSEMLGPRRAVDVSIE